MKITPIKTHKITDKDKSIYKILDKYVLNLKEKSVLAVASTIVGITEGRMVKIEMVDKDELIIKEADYYLPRSSSKYNVCITIKNNIIAASAGIDESNGNGYYILWPEDLQKSVNDIREYLKKKFKLKYVGVVITDSKTTPLRWGVTGIALAHSGFLAIKDYIGKRDLFGRKFEYEKINMMDSLAASAVITMGEGNEQTPLAIIEDVPFVEFRQNNPSKEELDQLHINIEDDLYAPFLNSVKWIKGDLSS